jgi:branched-chain amino acid aminotransferase
MDPKVHHANLIPSILAKIEANAAGADDALMLDTRGFVAETNATHVFAVDDGVLSTSRLVACPEGVTRAVVLELCREHDIAHAERDLTLTELYRSSEAFCTGTMGELAPILTIDGRTIGTGEPGSVTRRLSELFAAKVAAEAEEV